MSKIKILVDADSCPVKKEIIQVSKKIPSQVVMVASYDHSLPEEEGIQIIQVDRSDQAVDLFISNHISSRDVLITQDFGLAAIGLAKKAIVLSNRGQVYTDQTIDFLLARRHEQAKKRRSGKHTKGPKAFTQADRDHFLHTLTKTLETLQENNLI